MAPIRIAIVGVGKIARDQHVPSIRGNRDFELVATASRHGTIDGVPSFPDIEIAAGRRRKPRCRRALHAARPAPCRRGEGACRW